MNALKAVGYIFLGIGTILMIYSAILFFSIITVTSQIPIVGQTLSSVALAAVSPFLITGAIMYVVGGVSYYAGREKAATELISATKTEMTPGSLLDRLNRLETIVDNNFSVVTKRLDAIEEKQEMATQKTILKAKKQQNT